MLEIQPEVESRLAAEAEEMAWSMAQLRRLNTVDEPIVPSHWPNGSPGLIS